MHSIPATSRRAAHALAWLVALHIGVVIASNYLVQIPVMLGPVTSTWGAFTFPLIFLATDLTVRLIGKHAARRVIARAMIPALVASYLVGVVFHDGRFNGLAALAHLDTQVFRVAFASYAAYVLGQLLDVQVFDRIRRASPRWWPAPVTSAIFGQALDTATFFSIAFAASSNAFMATHWVEIALVDYAIKLTASLGFFVPTYGVLLTGILRCIRRPTLQPRQA